MDQESNKLHLLFKNIKCFKLINWDNKENIGLSLLLKYPSNIKFVPIKNQKGELDSYCLFRIGYYHDDKKVIGKITKVPLHISVGLTSLYKSKHHWYDYSDKDSPSEEAVKRSELSQQPHSLDDFDRFEYHVEKSKIYDLKNKEYISPYKLVDYFFKLHLSTLTNLWFLLKVKLREISLNVIKPIDNILKRINEIAFGKKMKEDTEFLVGELKPYKLDDLEDLATTKDQTTISKKMKILGSDIPITYQSAKTFILFILTIYLTNFYFDRDILGLYKLFTNANGDAVFSASLLIAFLLITDRLIPYVILYMINTLIRIKSYLTFLRIKI